MNVTNWKDVFMYHSYKFKLHYYFECFIINKMIHRLYKKFKWGCRLLYPLIGIAGFMKIGVSFFYSITKKLPPNYLSGDRDWWTEDYLTQEIVQLTGCPPLWRGKRDPPSWILSVV